MAIRIHRDKNQLKHTAYFELLPGPFKCQWWNDGSLFISEFIWDTIVEPLIQSYVDNYDRYETLDVPRAKWIRYLGELGALRSLIEDCESIGELQVELPWLNRFDPFEFEWEFKTRKAELLTCMRDLDEWLSSILEEHDSVAILGL